MDEKKLRKLNDFLDKEGLNSKEKAQVWALAYLLNDGKEPQIPVDFGIVYRIGNMFEVRSTFDPFYKDKIWGVKIHGLTLSCKTYPEDEDAADQTTLQEKGERRLTANEKQLFWRIKEVFDSAFKFLEKNGVGPSMRFVPEYRTTIDDSDWSEIAKKKKMFEIDNYLRLDFHVVYRNEKGDVSISETLEKHRVKHLWGVEIAGVKLSLNETPNCRLLYGKTLEYVAEKHERLLTVQEWETVFRNKAAFNEAINLLNEVLEKGNTPYQKLEGYDYPTSETRSVKKIYGGSEDYITRFNLYIGEAHEAKTPNYLDRTRTTLL